MGDDFNVSIGEVRAHAQTVGGIAANVRSVADSAQDSVSGGAFGQIAEFFASAITGAADVVRQSMNNAGEAVDHVRTGLNQAADNYQTTEDHHVQVFAVAGTGQVLKKVKAKSQKFQEQTNAQTNTVNTVGEATSQAQRRSR
jgi:hypothetical protein